MARHWTNEATAALVFIILYMPLLCWMTFAFITSRLYWKSRWGFLYFHLVIRLASQGCGVAFGVLGFANVSLVIAYLILNAQGLFTLLLITSKFIVQFHEHNRFNQWSFLQPRSDAPGVQKSKLVLRNVLWILKPQKIVENPLGFCRGVLVLGNILLITGACDASEGLESNPDVSASQLRSDLHQAKVLRTIGQAIFLAFSFILGGSILYTIGELGRKKDFTRTRRSHPTLYLFALLEVFILIRAVWGLLQACVDSLSYFGGNNFNAEGYTDRYVVLENVFGVATEWIGAIILLATYRTGKNDPPQYPIGQDYTVEVNSMESLTKRSQPYA